MPECYSCHLYLPTWRELAEHISEEHPDSSGADWAEQFLGTGRHYESKQKPRWTPPPRKADPYPPPNEIYHADPDEPLQRQAITILAMLFKANMTDGEIQALVSIAKKQAFK